MRNAAIAAAVVTLACGGAGTFGYTSSISGWVAGGDRTYTAEQWQATGERDVVLDQASRDFACAVRQLAVTRPNERAYVVTGCERRGVFVPVAVSATYAPSYGRGVNVLAVVIPPPTPLGVVNDVAAPGRWSSWDAALRWAKLAKQGAVDLACPLDQVTPDFIPQGRAPDLPVVEGCGKRATYLSERDASSFRLSALVDIGASEHSPP